MRSESCIYLKTPHFPTAIPCKSQHFYAGFSLHRIFGAIAYVVHTNSISWQTSIAFNVPLKLELFFLSFAHFFSSFPKIRIQLVRRVEMPFFQKQLFYLSESLK